MNISIEEVENAIKNTLGDSLVLSTNSVYEKIDGEDKLKLVIFFNKLFDENTSILYTKLIFITDTDKINIVDNTFLYLYDINCQYNNVDFFDLNELEEKLSNIIKKNKFGNNIKILSEFIEKPSFLINDWLKRNKVIKFSVNSVKYNPKVHITPCKSLVFTFVININNIEIDLNISNIDDVFIYSFNINNENINIEKRNLNTLIETIGDTLKNNII